MGPVAVRVSVTDGMEVIVGVGVGCGVFVGQGVSVAAGRGVPGVALTGRRVSGTAAVTPVTAGDGLAGSKGVVVRRAGCVMTLGEAGGFVAVAEGCRMNPRMRGDQSRKAMPPRTSAPTSSSPP